MIGKVVFTVDIKKYDQIGKDDFIRRVGDYCFRIEKMRKNYWWCRLYYKNDTVTDFDDESQDSYDDCVNQLESDYNNHKKFSV